MAALGLQSFGYSDLTFGVAGRDDVAILAADDQGVDGLDLPQFRTTLTPGQRHGSVPGSQWSDPVTVQARVWTESTETMLKVRQSMKPRPNPDDEIPWSFRGLGFPDQHRLWVRPEVCDYRVGRLATVAACWIMDLAWTGSDGVIYSDEVVTTRFGVDGGGGIDPTHFASFPVVNPGLDRTRTGRAFRFRMTARGGPVVRPFWRVVHDDGTVEQVTFDLVLPENRVLTVAADRVTRVGTVPQLGAPRSVWPGNVQSRSPRWPTLTAGDTNQVEVGCHTGEFSGNVETLGVW